MIRKLLLVFIIAFLLNWLWENLHSFLYVSYIGGAITPFILFRAAIFDAVIISIIIFVSEKFFNGRVFFIIITGLAVAIGIEIWAMQTGRWQYSDLMPIIPLLGVGLSPVFQLAITSLVVNKIIVSPEKSSDQ